MNKDIIKLPDFIYNEKFDINIKPYLTIDEVSEICAVIKDNTNSCEYEVSKWASILTFCCPNEDFSGMNYDELKFSGLLDVVRNSVINFDDIDSYVNNYKDPKYRISGIIDSIMSFCKKINTEKIIGKLKEEKMVKDA